MPPRLAIWDAVCIPSPDVHIRSIREKYSPDLEVYIVPTLHAGDCVGSGTAIGISLMIQESLATFGRSPIGAKCSDVRFVP